MMQEIFPIVVNVHMKYLAPFVIFLMSALLAEIVIDLLKKILVGGRRSARSAE